MSSCYPNACDCSVCLPEFPLGIQWTPSWDVSAPNEIVLQDIVHNRRHYWKAGKLVFFSLHVSMTAVEIGSSIGTKYIRFTLPLQLSSVYSIGGACLVSAGGADLKAGTFSANSLLQVNVGFFDAVKWQAGANKVIVIDGKYETSV